MGCTRGTAVAVVGERRIEVIRGITRTPAVRLNPMLSSAEVGWQGFLFEQHSSDTPHVVEFPDHYSTKHLLRLNTGGPSKNDWRIDGRGRRTHDEPGGVSILPAGTHVSVVDSSRSSCILLEINPTQLQQSSSDDRNVELAAQLTISDRQITLLMTAMQADLEAGSPAGPLYGESLGNALGTYLSKRYGTVAF